MEDTPEPPDAPTGPPRLLLRPARTIAIGLAILWIAWVTYEAYGAGRSSSAFYLAGTSTFAHAMFIVQESSLGVIGLAALAWLVETSGLLPPRDR